MKKNSIIVLAVVAMLFAGCDNKNSTGHEHDSEGNHTENVHEHEDGSLHEHHEDTEQTQEKFKVEGDSASIKK